MVRLAVSPNIQRIIRHYNVQKKLSEGEDGFINSNAAFIEHLSLAHIASALQADAEPTQKSHYTLDNILKTTSLYIEPVEKPKPVTSRRYVLTSESRIPSENGESTTPFRAKRIRYDGRER
jgi:hypothetical protein